MQQCNLKLIVVVKQKKIRRERRRKWRVLGIWMWLFKYPNFPSAIASMQNFCIAGNKIAIKQVQKHICKSEIKPT
jgi:hypothetical protein